MFISGSFHLGWKAQSAAEGELETGQFPTIFRKRRFLGLGGVCVCFLCQMDKDLGFGDSGQNLVN